MAGGRGRRRGAAQALGFNAVRMPFSFKDLWGLKPRTFNWECALVSAQTFLQSVTDPAVPFTPGEQPPPPSPPRAVAVAGSPWRLPGQSC